MMSTENKFLVSSTVDGKVVFSIPFLMRCLPKEEVLNLVAWLSAVAGLTAEEVTNAIKEVLET